MARAFHEVARECAHILRKVVSREIKTPAELQRLWPEEADAYECLVDAFNDVFEFWLLEPRVSYAPVLEASIRVLEIADDDPVKTKRLMEAEIDRQE